MSMFSLYMLFIVLPNLHDTNGLLFVLGMSGFGGGITYFISKIGVILSKEKSDEMEMSRAALSIGKPIMLTALSLFFFFYILGIVTPSENQVYKMAGGYVVMNDAELRKLPDNVAKAANAYLGKIAEEAEKKGKKE